jgi:hypothetical protein
MLCHTPQTLQTLGLSACFSTQTLHTHTLPLHIRLFDGPSIHASETLRAAVHAVLLDLAAELMRSV